MRCNIKGLIILSLGMIISIFSYSQIPTLNSEIIKYVDSVIGKKVDRGECWDLAYQALERNHAKWDGSFKYGKEIDPLKEKVFPGDIVQFKNVKTKIVRGNMTYSEEMKKHTAIIYAVYSQGKYQLAHQNTQKSGKKVGLNDFDLKTVIKGNIKFYRPTN